MKMILNTSDAPAPIGPYNQAVRSGNLLFVSGQIAIDPKTGELALGSNIEDETHLVLRNLEAILKNAGTSFDKVLKTTIFLKNMAQFARVNAVYGQYFSSENAPARETVEVSALPKYVNVEISAIAAVS